MKLLSMKWVVTSVEVLSMSERSSGQKDVSWTRAASWSSFATLVSIMGIPWARYAGSRGYGRVLNMPFSTLSLTER